MLSSEIVVVGFTCTACGKKVPVLSSAVPPPKLKHELVAECACGYLRRIPLETVQSLEVWKEKARSA